VRASRAAELVVVHTANLMKKSGDRAGWNRWSPFFIATNVVFAVGILRVVLLGQLIRAVSQEGK
jgi:hypothetical protein